MAAQQRRRSAGAKPKKRTAAAAATKRKLSPAAPLAYARGSSRYDAHPKNCTADTFAAFADAVLSDRAKRKGLAYVAAANSGGHRCAQEAEQRRWLAFDIDYIKDAATFKHLRQAFSIFNGFAYTTSSHTANKPRARAVVELDRNVTRAEGIALGAALTSKIAKQFGDTVEFDESVFRAEQPIYTPLVDAKVFRFNGKPLEVDRHISGAALTQQPKTAASASSAAGIAEGTRNNELTRRAGAMRSSGLEVDEIAAALLGINAAQCHPPLSEAEVRAIAQSVGHYPKGEPFTESGNAKRLIDAAGHWLRYCPTVGKWLFFDNVCWCWDTDGTAIRAMQVVVADMYKHAACIVDENRRKAHIKHAVASDSKYALQASVQLAQVDARAIVSADALDADPWMLGVKNGVIDLRTGKLLPPDPQLFITKQAGAAYDPAARCPVWLKFLDTIFAGDAAVISYLRRAVGYTLSGITTEKCLFFLYGALGDNGKSTLLETVLALLGSYGTKTRAETLMAAKFGKHGATPEVVALRGARLVAMSELSDRQRWEDSFVKDITGGIDQIVARNLYEGPQQFKPVLKLWGYGNHKPQLRADDDAAWRRMHLIPFLVRIPPAKQDKALGDKLRAELPGILNWALAGCLEWQRGGGLHAPSAVLQATADYRQEQDFFGQFIAECCTTGAGFSVELVAFYTKYQNWTTEGGMRYPLTKPGFVKQLEERGYGKKPKAKNKIHILGLRLCDK